MPFKLFFPPVARFRLFALILSTFVLPAQTSAAAGSASTSITKVRDVVIYEDAEFHSAFPSVVKRPGGELLVAFRRAPNRLLLGAQKNLHVDPNSYLVMARSMDAAVWDAKPELIFAHPFGGSQDPCLLQLSDGTLLCMSYGWTFVRPSDVPNLGSPVFENAPGYVFNGGYQVRSTDGGGTWHGPFYPPHIEPEQYKGPHGKPVPAYNRGAATEGRDGTLYWVCAANDRLSPRKTSTHLLISEDKGLTWQYSCPVAVDEDASFNETSILETARGDLVAFLRTANLNDEACIARSTDGGKSFQPWQGMGFQGHPLHGLRLADDRVLLVYGYRHKPFGIRARLLDAECTNFAAVAEVVLRDDGGTSDLGYPWSVQLDDTHVLVVYYFNIRGSIQHIAGTILAID